MGSPALDPSIIAKLNGMVAWVAGVVAVVCMVGKAAQLAWSRAGRPIRDLVRGLLTMTMATGTTVAMVTILTPTFDALSRWFIDQGTSGGDFNARVGGFAVGLGMAAPFLAIMLGALLVLASIANIALMVVRTGVLVLLVGVTVPLTAAASYTEAGWQFFRKTLG